jgi:hypothetical protein
MIDGLSRLADGLRSGIEEADVKRDRRRALRLYRIAASAGHTNAQYGLGKMYLGGEGVTKDRSYGMRWLGTAAKKRHSGAAEVLGDVYFESGDTIRALVWYRIAADTAGEQQSPRIAGQARAGVGYAQSGATRNCRPALQPLDKPLSRPATIGQLSRQKLCHLQSQRRDDRHVVRRFVPTSHMFVDTNALQCVGGLR